MPNAHTTKYTNTGTHTLTRCKCFCTSLQGIWDMYTSHTVKVFKVFQKTVFLSRLFSSLLSLTICCTDVFVAKIRRIVMAYQYSVSGNSRKQNQMKCKIDKHAAPVQYNTITRHLSQSWCWFELRMECTSKWTLMNGCSWVDSQMWSLHLSNWTFIYYCYCSVLLFWPLCSLAHAFLKCKLLKEIICASLPCLLCTVC